jgi:suppressor of G2 allele of SKP1
MTFYLCLQQESGGTVLSTNWKEVARERVEVKAPDGMEWHKWEQ